MKIKIALAASLVVSLLVGSNRLAAQETAPETQLLESRIAALEKQLRDIETQLVTLDFIATEVGKLSGKQVPQRAAGAARAAAADDVIADPADAAWDPLVDTEPPLPGDDLDDAAAEDATDEDLLALFDAPDQEDEPQADPPASSTPPPLAEDNLQPARSVEQRVTSIEQAATNIQSRLPMLDDIAEALDALAQKPGAADSVRTAAKPAGPATELSDDDTTTPRRSTLIVNNWTGVVHWITVNGARVRVDPGRNRIPAEYGALTTRVGDHEMQWDLTNWRTVGGGYELVLDLKP